MFSRVHGIFPGHDYWSGLPFPPPEDPPSQGIESVSPASPALQADSLPLSSPGSLLEHCLQLRQSLGPITPSSAIPIPTPTPANLRPGPRLQSSRSLRDSVLEQPSDSSSRPWWCSKGPESALPQPEPREEGSWKIQGPPPGPEGGGVLSGQHSWDGRGREAAERLRPLDILSTALRKSFYSILKNVYK